MRTGFYDRLFHGIRAAREERCIFYYTACSAFRCRNSAAMRDARARIGSARRSLEALERLAGKTDKPRVKRAAGYVEKAERAIAP